MSPSKSRGFTLIELMIVVAVIAILAIIAIPSYLAQVRKSRRSEVESAIQQAALLEERYRADCTTYANFGTTTCVASSTTLVMPAWSTLYSKTNYYSTPTVSNISATSYTIPVSAAASSMQLKDSQSGTDCSTLYYVYGADTTAAVVAKCSGLTLSAGQVSKCPVACWGN